jgi:hypothetical protein
LLSLENIEHSLLCIPEEAWQKLNTNAIVEQEDNTVRTGNAFVDEMEQALSDGVDINDIIKRLNTTK